MTAMLPSNRASARKRNLTTSAAEHTSRPASRQSSQVHDRSTTRPNPEMESKRGSTEVLRELEPNGHEFNARPIKPLEAAKCITKVAIVPRGSGHQPTNHSFQR